MTFFSEALLKQTGSWAVILLGGIAIVLAVGLGLSLYRQDSRSKYPLPPGPKGYPIIGNILQLPAERSEVQFLKWTKEYKSDIIYVNLLRIPVIVLNSMKSAVDLLDKRGMNYSDRPRFVMVECLGMENNIAMVSDGAHFRKLRRPYGNFLSATSSLEYRDAQLKHTRTLVDEIEKCPQKWKNSLSRYATRVTFSVGFAIDLGGEDDPYFKLADDMAWVLSNLGNNAISVLDLVPWLKHAPRWVGMFIPSIKFVHDHIPTVKEFCQRPFDAVIASYKAGTSKPSFMTRLLEEREMLKSDEGESIKRFTDEELKGTGGALFSAGHETTFSSETIFVMAAVLFPDVQIRAQKEIDAVTGGMRLPTFDDWKALPIVERIVYETLRFHPPVPNGVPHRASKEDVFRGMYIPKSNSIVIANAWAMFHDPDVYHDPFKFDPDRFLPASEGGADEPIPVGHFGFGRSIWIVVATILAKFKISPAKDRDGKDIMPVMEFTTGITR
ncbi:hypothetical protein B7494_g893 [Chlorociboria aeruginascens]|nr:hypothetical protein B7494_g893 [Chlorociboria aeruginascens]